MLEAPGAEVVLVPQVDGASGQVTGSDVNTAAEAARRVAAGRGGFYVNQFHAPECEQAHRETTGPEIWAQSGGRVDAWVAPATFLGVAAFLRERNPAVTMRGGGAGGLPAARWSPRDQAPPPHPGHKLRQLAAALGRQLMDFAFAITDGEVEGWRRLLATREGMYIGSSAAANVGACAALLASGRLPAEASVATVLCDSGLKY